jgi:hypothetical protein
MAMAVYVLCGLTSLACSILLLRGYSRTGARLLLWSSLCFVGLALDNLFLILDILVGTAYNLSLLRRLPGLVGVSLLVYGLIWDSK